MEISSPRTFPAFPRTSKELIEIPHVIRRTAVTTRRHAISVGTHGERRDEVSQAKHPTSNIQARLPLGPLLVVKKTEASPGFFMSARAGWGGGALDELAVVPVNQRYCKT